MTNERFKELLEELDGNSVKTLAEKNARYSADSGDALHNFKEGAEIAGGTPAQACWGYMTKHLVALRDKVKKNDFSDKEDFLEKCQDTINYIRFLWCIGNENEEESIEAPDDGESDDIVLYVMTKDTNHVFSHYYRCERPKVFESDDEYKVVFFTSGKRIVCWYSKDQYYLQHVK